MATTIRDTNTTTTTNKDRTDRTAVMTIVAIIAIGLLAYLAYAYMNSDRNSSYNATSQSMSREATSPSATGGTAGRTNNGAVTPASPSGTTTTP